MEIKFESYRFEYVGGKIVNQLKKNLDLKSDVLFYINKGKGNNIIVKVDNRFFSAVIKNSYLSALFDVVLSNNWGDEQVEYFNITEVQGIMG